MRVLYVAMADDYGKPERGPSFEETNFRGALDGMGHDVVAFDFMRRMQAVGKAAMRRELVAAAAEAKPDVAFFCLFTDELDTATIEAVGREGGCPTVNWFADDHWRFDDFSRHMAPAFDLAVTTDADSLPKYEAAGLGEKVLLSQWACNRYAYGRVDGGPRHEVTFVGQPHGNREEIIQRLVDAGHRVECWGFGWPAGKLDHDAMVRVFATSRVNLNLSNSSTVAPKTLRAKVGKLLGRGPKGPQPAQIKGRNFEVPGCGGFLLTERVPHLERYFELGREVAVYDSTEDLVEQVGYWLSHEDERVAVAEAGYRRVTAEHTYDHRFDEIFRTVGAA
jgi:spore maturation protein CgeB